jgi:hypothetical protein
MSFQKLGTKQMKIYATYVHYGTSDIFTCEWDLAQEVK